MKKDINVQLPACLMHKAVLILGTMAIISLFKHLSALRFHSILACANALVVHPNLMRMCLAMVTVCSPLAFGLVTNWVSRSTSA